MQTGIHSHQIPMWDACLRKNQSHHDFAGKRSARPVQYGVAGFNGSGLRFFINHDVA